VTRRSARGRRRLARAALLALLGTLASGAAVTDSTAATSLFIKNHVNSNDVRGIAMWGGVLAAATTGGVVTVAMPAGPLGFTLAGPGGLPTNQTLCVATSPSGDLWIGTVDHGVARESPAGRWRRALTTFDGLPSERVQVLLRAGDSAWVGTDGGAALFAENRSNARVTLRRSDSSEGTAGGLVSNDVRAFAVAGDTLWCGTGGGLSSFASGVWLDRRAVFGGPVSALAMAGDTLWVATAAGPRAYAGGALAPVEPGHLGQSLALAEAGGELYSGTSGSSVFRRVAGGWVATGAGLPLGLVNALGVAPDGALWAGTQAGLVRRDAASDAWTAHRAEGPAVDNLWKAAVRGGDVWFVTGNATDPDLGSGLVLRTDGTSWSVITSAGTGGALQAASTFGILASREGPMWFGHCCSPGPPPPRVDRFDPAAGAWLAPGGSNVLAFGQAPSGRVYAASDRNGVFVYDSATGALLDSLTPANTAGSASGAGLLSDEVHAAAIDPAGVGWFATDAGVDRWNGHGTDVHSDDFWTHFAGGFPSPNTTAILALDSTRVYVGTQSGVAVLTGGLIDAARKNAITTAIGAAEVTDLARDPRGIVWIATRAGLARFDDATLQAELFTTADGLVDDDVQGLAWDEARGVLWVATRHGASEVHPQEAGEPAFDASAYVYPNPARPGTSALWIGGLSGVASGEIRDVSGRLVRHIHVDPVSNAAWDLRDASGAPAAPGIYLIVLRDGGRVRILRAAVMR
jgi:ligand-binding sensor domain-containing protein